MRNLVRTLPLLALTLAAPTRAGAQQAAADALFDSARAAMERAEYAQACEQFRASDELDPAVGTELNLADCEEKRGHLASAWELFRTVEEKLPETDERVAVAHARAQALAPRVPRLTLRLAPSAPRDCTVRDGKIALGAGAFGVPLPLEPGAHELVVSAPGFESRTFQVRLAEGELQTLTVAPGAAHVTSPVPVASALGPNHVAARGASPTRKLGFALTGVGAAGLGVAAISGLLVLTKKHAVDDGCQPDKSCTAEGLAAAHSGHTLQTVSNISWVVGAAGLGVGAYLLWSGEPSAQPSTAILFSTTPGAGKISLKRSF